MKHSNKALGFRRVLVATQGLYGATASPCEQGRLTTKEHTPQLPEGSGNELAKGVTWGVAEDRKGGEGRSPTPTT